MVTWFCMILDMSAFKRKKIQFVSWWKSRYLKLYRHYFWVLIILWVSWILWVSFLIVNLYRYQDKYIVKTVVYTSGSLLMYDDPWIYSQFSSQYQWKSFIDIDILQKNQIIYTMQELFPFLQDIEYKKFNNNTLLAHIVFRQPDVIVSVGNRRFALYPSHILPLYSGNMLWFSAPQIFLPQYLSGISTLSGLLYIQSLPQLIQDIQLLKTLPLAGSITYIPGAEKYVYWDTARHIYFNAKKSLTGQIESLQKLIQYYKWFDKLIKIDLGSNDLIVVR